MLQNATLTHISADNFKVDRNYHLAGTTGARAELYPAILI